MFKETIGALSNNSSGFNHETLGFDLIHEELAIYSNYSLYMPLYIKMVNSVHCPSKGDIE